MSYLSIALQRRIERRQMSQSDLARQSGLSKSFISRLFSGIATELSDDNFTGVLKAFAADPQAQAELVAARCMDVKAGVADTPGSALVEISIKKNQAQSSTLNSPSSNVAHVELSQETERAFAWLRSQCPVNPELEKHIVGYAKLTGMK